MPTTLLYKESPIIGTVFTITPVVLYMVNYKILAAIFLIVLVFLLFFYRHYEHIPRYPDNTIVCPADGTVTKIIKGNPNSSDKNMKDVHFISIFLSPMNIHTQIYPANALVLSHTYDHTGKFDIVSDSDKSRENEKAIHMYQLPNNAVIQFNQIAGFLPRRIVYDEQINHTVVAGSYMGMIKFGSRVDLYIPVMSPDRRQKFVLSSNIQEGSRITIGDLVGRYE